MISFDLVPLHRIYHEISPNVARHYAEMTEGDEYGEPDLDWTLYLALSEADRCVAVTLRDGGKLVGYSVFVLGSNPRYKARRQADNAGLFIEKPYRAKYHSAMIKKSNKYLKKIGVHEAVYILSDDRVGRLLARHGAESKYKVWSIKYGQL